MPFSSDDDYVYLFTNGGEHHYAAWTTSKPHAVKIAIGGGRWFVRDHLGKPEPAVTAKGGEIEVTLTDAPQYLLSEPGHW